MLRITGKTYDYRDLLTTYGAKWEPATKSWLIGEDDWSRLVERNSHGTNKRDRERSAAVASWTSEPVEPDAKADAITEIKRLMAVHGITEGDLR